MIVAAAGMVQSSPGVSFKAINVDLMNPQRVHRRAVAPWHLRSYDLTAAEASVQRVVDAVSGRDEPGLEALSRDAKLLRTFDLAGVVIWVLAGCP